jgi:hypothetical protein
MSEEQKTYSIALRLRRVVYEDAYVAVPVTDAIIKANDDGTGSIDFEALVAEAIRIGESPGVEWRIEESHSEPHPVQGPRPEDRHTFDAYYSQDDAP